VVRLSGDKGTFGPGGVSNGSEKRGEGLLPDSLEAINGARLLRDSSGGPYR
jgi:hypothetical protein